MGEDDKTGEEDLDEVTEVEGSHAEEEEDVD